ncbi:poly(A) polymerase cid, putative [Ricinus communis]|uniref:Poly(A) polymerase cid, putative n=1 Tax=Ricinus communis TaxID=3988 RepID=B9RDG6_RICCO|nr:poly(A) polymerase cid, putative [Ricinus communis]
MNGGGGNAPPMQPVEDGGEFLLSLLQRSNHQTQTPPQQQPQFPVPIPITPSHQQQQQQLAVDPAVAAVGPSIPFATSIWQSNGHDILSPPPAWPYNLSPPNLVPGLLGFPQNHPWQGSQFQGSDQRGFLGDDLQRLGLSSGNTRIRNLVQQKQQLEQKLQFGSFRSDIQPPEGLLNLNSKLNAAKELGVDLGIRNLNGMERNLHFEPQLMSNLRTSDLREQDQRGGWGKQPHGSNYRSQETRMPPPGFSNKPRGGGNMDHVSRRRELDHNVNKEKGNHSELSKRNAFLSSESKSLRDGNGSRDLGLTRQLDHPGPPAGSNLHSVSALDIEESLLNFNAEMVEDGKNDGHDLDDVGEELADTLLLEGESEGKNDNKQNRHSRDKESRSDNRGQQILSQRMRMLKRQMECRRDIDRLNVSFLAIYESLIPPEEEKSKQKQLLTLLEKLVNKEWPEARLYLYGSCANSFGVRKSDIDVCLAIQDADINKSEVLLKLADILQSDNLQNVQALTRARVPIVKLMDPVTGISCDICINNVLAVVNTKLLWDYSQIDQRRPAVLPCLQEMDTTYSVTVDDIECAYFDQVEKLQGLGSRNKETIAQLVWAFFNYWAYRHDYANDVISVRKGTIISKWEKDWTRRIGNDRHLICIEDPFEISHDLGRVVDKYSIKVLREEFERAANIMQYDPNPCVKLFEPYVPS